MTELLNPTQLLLAARQRGVFCWADDASLLAGLAQPGVVLVSGKDAGSFLQSQLTSDVTSLSTGEGQLSARVTRKGHLTDVFSLHALWDPNRQQQHYLLLTEQQRCADLIASLDGFVFSEDVVFDDRTSSYAFLWLLGPNSPEVVNNLVAVDSELLYALHVAPWAESSAKNDDFAQAAWLTHLGLTGDPCFLLALPKTEPDLTEQPILWMQRCNEAKLTETSPKAFSSLLETLRMESGTIRVGSDTTDKPRLLPETGLEQHVVSYTKGCYLGQEIIARIRTYGQLPTALRGLLFEADDTSQGEALLSELPAPGEPVTLVDGTSIGIWSSRSYSPNINAVLAYAYLKKNHRTPGATFLTEGRSSAFKATVRLLPVYTSAQQGDKATALYDQAIAFFADGQEKQALDNLEKGLQLDPGFADAYEAIGVMLGRSGAFHEAIDFFRRLEEVAPDEPMVYTNLSLYYMKLGDQQTAEEQAAIALEKQLGRTSKTTAHLSQEPAQARIEDAKRKKDMFSRVLEIDAEDPVAWFGLGRALSSLGQWEQARDALQAAKQFDKNNSVVYLSLGKAMERLFFFEEAIDVYEQGIVTASRKGDLMPLKEMESRLLLLRASQETEQQE